ncbi:MAG: spore protease YyaC [Sporolactobacillus sp.]
MYLKKGHGKETLYQPVHYQNSTDHWLIVDAIRQLLPHSGTPIVIICIGTDRSTGDSLGPLVGMQLESYFLPGVSIYGTLDQPVHAVNLEDTLSMIHSSNENSFILAIDACLGKQENIGKINVSTGPVLPGAGVNKKLVPVGDMHITGIVNISGFMEYSVLQNTRLSVVMNLSKIISQSIMRAIKFKESSSMPSKKVLF